MRALNFTLLAAGLLLLSCSKNKQQTSTPTPQACTQVVDRDTKQPVGSVQMIFNQGSGGYYVGGGPSFEASTDGSGNACIDKDRKFSSIYVSRNGYVSKSLGSSLPAKIELQAFAYVKLHIKNEPPASASDYITIYTRPDLGIGVMGDQGQTWMGITDTTITLQVNPEAGYIKWKTSSGMEANINYSATGGQVVTLESIIY